MSDILNLRTERPDKEYKITLDGKEFVKITDKLPVANIIEMASLEQKGEKITSNDIAIMLETIKNIMLIKTKPEIVDRFIKQIDSKDIADIFQYINEKCKTKLDEKKK